MKNIQRILIIGSVWPEPSSSAAGSRTLQLVELFLSLNWEVTFASTASDSEYMIDFSKWNMTKVFIQLNDPAFDVFISTLQPTFVIFDRFMTEEQFGWRVAAHCPQAVRILDTIDLHCLRIVRQKAIKEDRKFQENDLLREEISKREIASILRSDLSLIISQKEFELLRDVFKIEAGVLHYLPFLLEPLTEKIKQEWLPFHSREHFITIGNFLHEPNWNAVLYLKQELWPLIKKELPNATLQVYGAYCSKKATALHHVKEGFLVKGRAERAHAVISKAKVVLAPLRFGAGIKGKLIDAMQCGTPSVTTAIGAEGMHDQLNWNGFIEDEPTSFAKAAIELYTNETIWQQCQENGRQIVNTIYCKETLEREFINRLLTLQDTLQEKRLKNFMGSILMHHTLASTKYLSKWIEAKNKLTG